MSKPDLRRATLSPVHRDTLANAAGYLRDYSNEMLQDAERWDVDREGAEKDRHRASETASIANDLDKIRRHATFLR